MNDSSPATAPAAPAEAFAAADNLVDRIDALLPQTQCRRCGYDGCRPYAQAVARGQADINRCPPGGTAGIAALATLLARAPLPLERDCGSEQDAGVAWIDAQACIGCARCLPPCPVDAIIGAQRYLHSVLESHCNGCELCLSSCPVDCIVMRPRNTSQPAPTANDNHSRYERHRSRDERSARERAVLLSERKSAALAPSGSQ